MPTYRIFLQGYVNCEPDEGRSIPQTRAAILDYFNDMSLAIGDIEGLHLSMRPLTAAEEADEARKLEESVERAREIGEQMRRERGQRKDDGKC